MHVVSVSLGSRTGDFTRDITLGGQQIRLTREGTDGNFERAHQRIQELDGTVDALGLGGIDIYLYVNGHQLVIGDGLRLAQAARQTPVVDGSGLKNTLERTVVRDLAHKGLITAHSRVLMVSALDRFGMAEAFVNLGCSCVFGDIIFNIGLDFPQTTLTEIEKLALKYKERLRTVPFHMLYPTGAAQDQSDSDTTKHKYYRDADVIAGDCHLILRHLPEHVGSKGIVTNTTREHSMQRLESAGVRWVATTTPNMDGVSGATNLMEAALVALIKKSPADITPQDYEEWIERLGWCGAIHPLN